MCIFILIQMYISWTYLVRFKMHMAYCYKNDHTHSSNHSFKILPLRRSEMCKVNTCSLKSVADSGFPSDGRPLPTWLPFEKKK